MKKNDVQEQKTEVVYVLLSKKEKTFLSRVERRKPCGKPTVII